jgi:hypothetical protein
MEGEVFSDITSSTQGRLCARRSQGDQKNGDKDQGFDEGQQTEAVESHGPGIKKHGLDIEDDEDQREHVVADIELNPSPTNRLHA